MRTDTAVLFEAVNGNKYNARNTWKTATKIISISALSPCAQVTVSAAAMGHPVYPREKERDGERNIDLLRRHKCCRTKMRAGRDLWRSRARPKESRSVFFRNGFLPRSNDHLSRCCNRASVKSAETMHPNWTDRNSPYDKQVMHVTCKLCTLEEERIRVCIRSILHSGDACTRIACSNAPAFHDIFCTFLPCSAYTFV